MEKEIIATKHSPAALGPYSQAVKYGDLLFVSGQTGRDLDGAMPDGVAEQAAQALSNIGQVLAAGGSGFDKILKATVFLTDMGDFEAVNNVYCQYINSPHPARSCVQVAALPKGGKVEIEVIAGF